MKTNREIKNVSDFIQKINQIELDENNIRFFRGHGDKEYLLLPSIYRIKDTNKEPLINNEDKMINEILSSCPTDFEKDKSIFEKLSRLQHYGFPTRLLDITRSPLVALYFAASSHEDKNGEIIIFDIPQDNIKFSNSDTVSIISAMSLLSKEFSVVKIKQDSQKKYDNNFFLLSLEKIYKFTQLEKTKTQLETLNPDLKGVFNGDFRLDMKRDDIPNELINEHKDLISLTHFVRDEKPGFRNVINIDDLEKVLCVIPKSNNRRITNQQGAFLLFGIKENKIQPADCLIPKAKIIVSKDAKKQIIKELETLGINKSFLFPELEKQAEYIKTRYENIEKNK